MTDTTQKNTTLSPVAQSFILHWGEMGTRWGINRTVAQVHALLYISKEPLNAEQISDLLSVARSNVSTSLRELQSWGIIQTVQKLGDRCEYFTSMADVWEMFRIIAKERKRREVDPTMEVLENCMKEAKLSGREDAHLVARLSAMHEFFDTATKAYASVEKVPTSALVKVARMGDRIWKLLGVK
jgi:DNA-binding transcriptional regulator GbsR (MarR family)